MVGIAISLLWFLVGAIILGGVIYLIIKVATRFLPIDANIIWAIWMIYFILCAIYILYSLSGGGGIGYARNPFAH